MKFGIGGEALKASAKSGFIISAIFSASLNSIKWLFEEDYRWSDWISNLSVDITKIAAASIAGYLTSKAVAGGLLMTLGAAPAVLPIGAGLLVCIVVGMTLSRHDFKDQIDEMTALLEHYETKIRNFDETLLDGVYYIADETGKAIRHSIKRLFLSKLKSFRQSLDQKWLY